MLNLTMVNRLTEIKEKIASRAKIYLVFTTLFLGQLV